MNLGCDDRWRVGLSEGPIHPSWDWDSYLDWEKSQPIRYELVDGNVYAMGGGTTKHDTIGNNIRSELRSQLRGKPCRSHGPDLKVRAGANGRYPDALIDCGPRRDEAVHAQEPTVIFEVLSRSTAWIDQSLKLRDYEATPSVRFYILVSQDEPKALIYRRDQFEKLGISNAILLEGFETSIDIPDFKISLPFSLVYEGVEFNQKLG